MALGQFMVNQYQSKFCSGMCFRLKPDSHLNNPPILDVS